MFLDQLKRIIRVYKGRHSMILSSQHDSINTNQQLINDNVELKLQNDEWLQMYKLHFLKCVL